MKKPRFLRTGAPAPPDPVPGARTAIQHPDRPGRGEGLLERRVDVQQPVEIGRVVVVVAQTAGGRRCDESGR